MRVRGFVKSESDTNLWLNFENLALDGCFGIHAFIDSLSFSLSLGMVLEINFTLFLFPQFFKN